MCQNYDNSNDLKGTPYSRPNRRVNKQDLPALVQVGIVPDMNIPVLSPQRWSVISQALNDNQQVGICNLLLKQLSSTQLKAVRQVRTAFFYDENFTKKFYTTHLLI
jgi:hypothetical protein